MSDKVAIILGYGPRVGVDVAKALAENGFKVAVVSRSGKLSESAVNYLQFQANLADPNSLEDVFAKFIRELGHPSVVVYNGKLFCIMFKSTWLILKQLLLCK